MKVGSTNLIASQIKNNIEKIGSTVESFEKALEAAQNKLQQPEIQGNNKIEQKPEIKVTQKDIPQINKIESAAKMIEGLKSDQVKLKQIIQEIESGKTFSPAELIKLQQEVHQLSLKIEVTTKAVGEVVSNVKQLLQQQI